METMYELPNTSAEVQKVVVDEATITEGKPPLRVLRERQPGDAREAMLA